MKTKKAENSQSKKYELPSKTVSPLSKKILTCFCQYIHPFLDSLPLGSEKKNIKIEHGGVHL